MTTFPSTLGAIVGTHVYYSERPVKLIVHESEGGWSFLCGGADHGLDPEGRDYRWIAVGILSERDFTINETSSMARGMEAERAEIGGTWKVKRVSKGAKGAGLMTRTGAG